MQFKKFTSIENVEKKGLIDKIYNQGLYDGVWQVTEKVDGSHYEFYYDGLEILPAKRSSLMTQDASFFNHVPVFNKYKDNVKALRAILCDTMLAGYTSEIRVCGELYGNGILPRIYYREQQDFLCFDIYVDGIPLPADVVEQLCYLSDIPHVHVHGYFETLEAALRFQNDLPTFHADKFVEGNISEGTVIRPVEPKRFGNGERVIIKNKNDKFKEQTNAPKKAKGRQVLTPEAEANLESLLKYATESRVYSVASKIGTITQKDFGKLQGLFIQDLLEDAEKDGITLLPDFERAIKKEVLNACVTSIRKVFLELKQ